MRDVEHARMMLALAREDLAALEIMKESRGISLRIFGFHAQQAAEKTLKAWLSLLGAAYPRTHLLNSLFDLLQDQATAADRFRDLEYLTPFAAQFRYEVLEDTALEEMDRTGITARVATLIAHVDDEIRSAEAAG